MTGSIVRIVTELGIERLAHFTPSKNLFHIIQDGQIRSNSELADMAPEYFAPTDLERFDSHPDMTSVSFTYPNGYYLAQARRKPQFSRFPDWVCLMLETEVLSRAGVLFSPGNAARGRGVHLAGGPTALQECFASVSITGYRRGAFHLATAATDVQAEALVPGPIGLDHLTSIVVPSKHAAGDEYARLDVGGLAPDRFNWIVAPQMFDRDRLSRAIRLGDVIDEFMWSPSGEER